MDIVNSPIGLFFQRLISTRNIIITISITSFFIALIIYEGMNKYMPKDPLPQILYTVPEPFTLSHTSPVTVMVGMYISNFSEFDPVKNKFVVNLTLMFEFDPALISLETIEQFSFEKATILSKQLGDIKQTHNNLLVTYNVRLEFKEELNYANFPFDDHRLSLTLNNHAVTPKEMLFYVTYTAFNISKKIDVGGWKIVGKHLDSGFGRAQLDIADTTRFFEYPIAVFSIDIQNAGFRKIFIILIPIMLLFFLALFTFSLDPIHLDKTVLTLSAATLTGIIAYRFVIEQLIPNVGYFTSADHIFNIFLVSIFLAFLIDIFSVNKGNTPVIMFTKGLTILFTQLFIVISLYFLMFRSL